MLDLTASVVVTPDRWTGPRRQAVHVLVEEVRAAGVRWPVVHGEAPGTASAVVFSDAAGPLPPEGFHIRAGIDPSGATLVRVDAADARGVLFAVGWLVRQFRRPRGRVFLPGPVDLTTAPRYPVRGHQLGYRPKNNTYDAWSPAQYERYIRELALFGANFIELLPPRTDDAETNALMRFPKEEMLAAVTAALARYGLGAGLWYPLMAADYAEAGTIEAELAAAEAVCGLCSRLDAVFVPGGDPGHTPPDVLLPFLARLAAVTHRRHPGAEMWVSPQGFRPPQLQEFLRLVRRERPPWLTGVVYGPWTACTLAEMQAALPEGCAVRLYPDIGHTIHCQFPVVGWDPAYAATLGREPVNPLPRTQASLVRALLPGTTGFVTYSEGVNDDVNKFVWTALGWDPEADVGDVLRQYARALVGGAAGSGRPPEADAGNRAANASSVGFRPEAPEARPPSQEGGVGGGASAGVAPSMRAAVMAIEARADALAQALLALERNWDGPLLTNTQVPLTLAQLQAIERASSPEELGNWRLQAALYRAYYDAHVRRRVVGAMAREERARDWVERAHAGLVGADEALARACEALAEERGAPDGAGARDASAAWRTRIHELADGLFAAIGMQLSVARHGASALERGANLEPLDAPLGDGPWLLATLQGIATLGSQAEREAALRAFDPWHAPAPGGFLDDLGRPGAQPHLVGRMAAVHDPNFLQSVWMVPAPAARGPQGPWPQLWRTAAETLYGVPLVLEYRDLDPEARYRVRVLYHGRYRAAVSLEAGDGTGDAAGGGGRTLVHGPLRPADPPAPAVFDVPAEATAGGRLRLTWRLEEGRGIQVAAVWLDRAGA